MHGAVDQVFVVAFDYDFDTYDFDTFGIFLSWDYLDSVPTPALVLAPLLVCHVLDVVDVVIFACASAFTCTVACSFAFGVVWGFAPRIVRGLAVGAVVLSVAVEFAGHLRVLLLVAVFVRPVAAAVVCVVVVVVLVVVVAVVISAAVVAAAAAAAAAVVVVVVVVVAVVVVVVGAIVYERIFAFSASACSPFAAAAALWLRPRPSPSPVGFRVFVRLCVC